jgi:hypothetical protein
MRSLRSLPLLFAVMALLACNLFTPPPDFLTPVPATTQAPPTRPPAETPLPATPTQAGAPPTETLAPTPGPSATAAATLSAQGPWWVFAAEDGLWAANADGSGLTQVMEATPYLTLGQAAPQGGRVAVVTGTDAEGLHGRTLWLLTLPGGELTQVAALTSAETEPPPDPEPGGEWLGVLWVLGQAAWSPDGGALAFIGAQAGPSADLFVYDVASGAVTRLTDGPSQAYSPSWSPDGRYIVQMGAESFGSGAGYVMAGVWAAAADGSGVKPLYTPDSGDEVVVGWAAADAFVVASFYARCAYGNVRTVNITSGATQPMFEGFYSQFAADPATGVGLFAVDEFVVDCNPGGSTGLFLARPGEAPQLLGADLGEATRLGWSPEAGLFYARAGEAWIGFTPDGQPAPLPGGLNGNPLVGAGGRNWAWVDDDLGGLVASLGGAEPVRLYDGDVVLPSWSPDGETLLFFGDGTLYSAAAQASPATIVARSAEMSVSTALPGRWVLFTHGGP